MVVKRRNENKVKRTKRVCSHKRVKRSSKRNRRSFLKKNKRIKRRTQKRKRVLMGGMEAAGGVVGVVGGVPRGAPIILTIYCEPVTNYVKGDTEFKFMKPDLSPNGRTINGIENKYFTLVEGGEARRFNFSDGWNHWAYAFDIVADYVITKNLKYDARFEVNFVIEGTEETPYKYELFFETVKLTDGGVGMMVVDQGAKGGIYRPLDDGRKAYLVEKKYEKQCVCRGIVTPLTEKVIYRHIVPATFNL